MATSKAEINLNFKSSKQAIGGKTPLQKDGGNTASKNDPKKSIGGDFAKVSKQLEKAMSDLGRRFTDASQVINKSNIEVVKELKALKSSLAKSSIGGSGGGGNGGGNGGGSRNPFTQSSDLLSKVMLAVPGGLGLLIGGALKKTLDVAGAFSEGVSAQSSTIGMAGLQRRNVSSAFSLEEYGSFIKSAKMSSGRQDIMNDVENLSRIENYKLKYGLSAEEVGSLVGTVGGSQNFGNIMDNARRVKAGTQTQEYMSQIKQVLEEAVKGGMNSSEVAKIGDDFAQTMGRLNLFNKSGTIDLAIKLTKAMYSVRGSVAKGDISNPLAFRYATTTRNMLKEVDQASLNYLKKQNLFGDMSNIKAGDDLTKMFDASTIGAMIEALQSVKGKSLDASILKDFYNQSGGDFGRFRELMRFYFPDENVTESAVKFKSANISDLELKKMFANNYENSEGTEEGEQGTTVLRRVNNLNNNAQQRRLSSVGERALDTAEAIDYELNRLVGVISGSEGVTSAMSSLNTVVRGFGDAISNTVEGIGSAVDFFRNLVTTNPSSEVNQQGN